MNAGRSGIGRTMQRRLDVSFSIIQHALRVLRAQRACVVCNERSDTAPLASISLNFLTALRKASIFSRVSFGTAVSLTYSSTCRARRIG